MNTFIRLRLFSSSYVRKGPKEDWKRNKDRRFIDWKKVRVCGGKGGDGIASFKCPTSSKVLVGGPDGGEGGHGGNVIFEADASLRSLRSLQSHYKAGSGSNGGKSYHTGRSGRDVVVKVPPGTLIRDHLSFSKEVTFDLLTPGSSCMVAKGGEGGLGNAMFSTARDRKPVESTLGTLGEERMIEVELRTIADVGLVGFPNAGKSTLLRVLSRARPKVGSYPFTTLNPQIGVMTQMNAGEGEGGEDEEYKDRRITIADIPGLVPGAHCNKGLGHSFLKHVQRCPLLLYVLDASHPHTSMATQLHHLQEELTLYDKELLKNGRLIVANKMDICGEERTKDFHLSGTFLEDTQHLQDSTGLPVIPISGLLLWNIEPLKEALFRITKQLIS